MRSRISYPKLAKLSVQDMNSLIHETLFRKCGHPFDSQERSVVEDGNSIDSDFVCTLCGSAVSTDRVPNYAGSIDAAFACLMQLKTEGYTWDIRARQDGVSCLLFSPEDTNSIGTLMTGSIPFELCVLMLLLLGDVNDSRLTPGVIERYGVGRDG